MQFFLLAFRYILIIAVISLHKRVILNIIFGVKYHFDVRFPITYITKLKKTNVVGLCLSSKKEAAFDRHEETLFR